MAIPFGCQISFFKGRDWYGFWAIPFGETTAGANRFQPPVPKAPLNDGKVSLCVLFFCPFLSLYIMQYKDLFLGINLTPQLSFVLIDVAKVMPTF